MTTIADDPAASLIDPPKTAAAAVSYLRVSTREQAEKGGTDEGFSIPAQREATRRKAEQLGAGIVEEFVDAGASAKSSDRPELMRMIQYVKANKVAYCIVHKVDRLARNRADDVSIHLALQQCGVMLVSASENIDETPSGMLLHGIMSTIAEFYSRNLATEVAKGMTQKAIGGGTNGRAPIGYLNVRKRDELGREVRTIELDPERAPMIEWAFKAYASGNWSVSQLHDELTSRGLRSLPTPKRPAKPLAVSTIHRLLTNPYYKGDVVYRGTRYKGNHPALVPAEVWYQVQSVLTAHQCAVEATQVHGHYLKGTIHCGQCGSRLIVSNAKNRHGNVYCYFVCSGRHSKRTDCTRQAMLIEDVEKLVEDYYTRVQITPAQQDALAGMLHHEFDRLMAAETEELERLTTNRDRLESEQDRLMQAHYADAIPLSVLKREQDRIVAELDQVTRRIDAHYGDYADARSHLDDALGLLANCADIYTRCDDTNRRLCNQAFFTKVFIDEDNELRVEHNRPFEMLLDPQVNANALTWAADAHKARTSTNVSVGKGSSLVRAVDLRGLEPLTPCMPCRCATSCATDPGSRANAHPTTLLLYTISGLVTQIGGVRRGVRRLQNRGHVDERAVLPEALQLVELSLLLVEHVHDQIAEVEQNPAPALAPLTTNGAHARSVQSVLDSVGDGLHVALDATAQNEERIREREQVPHPNRDRGRRTFGVRLAHGDLQLIRQRQRHGLPGHPNIPELAPQINRAPTATTRPPPVTMRTSGSLLFSLVSCSTAADCEVLTALTARDAETGRIGLLVAGRASNPISSR